MRVVLLDLTWPDAASNLAVDEALLDLCDHGNAGETIRFWEPQEYFAVLGYANRASRELDLDRCRDLGVPVLRRCSGGGAVLQGKGCLNYSLVLRIRENHFSETIFGTNQHIMEEHAKVCESMLGQTVRVDGVTDLTVGGRKFSGNAQRRKRNALLFHGTFLLDFDLDLVTDLLPMPSKAPDYRDGRPHQDFLTNVSLTAQSLKNSLRNRWEATQPFTGDFRLQELIGEKYACPKWNLKF